MPLFYTDSVTLSYADVEAAKRWWTGVFDCKVMSAPSDWDCPLPSDVALQLQGHDTPTILLSSRTEMGASRFRPTFTRRIGHFLQPTLEKGATISRVVAF